jgi:hypothetical protein
MVCGVDTASEMQVGLKLDSDFAKSSTDTGRREVFRRVSRFRSQCFAVIPRTIPVAGDKHVHALTRTPQAHRDSRAHKPRTQPYTTARLLSQATTSDAPPVHGEGPSAASAGAAAGLGPPRGAGQGHQAAAVEASRGGAGRSAACSVS